MFRLMGILVIFVVFTAAHYGLAQDLYNQPESAEYDAVRDRYLISNWGDGNIIQIDRDGTESFFDTSLASSVGMVILDDILYVSADTAVVGFDLATGQEVWSLIIPEIDFYNDLAFDSSGYLYVTDYMPIEDEGGI